MSTAVVRPSDTRAADPICSAAVESAWGAVLEDAGPEAVGGHLGFTAEGERLVTHRFTCTLPGYLGWEWRVTLVRAPRARTVSVNEVSLAPGADALLPPSWVPWSQRLQPGDLTPGAIIATDPHDARLAPGWSGDDALTEPLDPAPLHPVNWEPGIQRRRVPSRFGRDSAATRWYAGDHGPRSPMAKAAPGHCQTCGWMLTMGGPLGQLFGLCSNLLSPSDGRVVAFDHGCGGHSEAAPHLVRSERVTTTLDEVSIDEIDMGHS